ncbi:MAG: DUF6163 family protein [Aliihoeflea sp.]|uniref:DUF6163 family protein n=1 Tax=Aliihoeflea sp. 40Bstr573 TaxID=2696467 RepID=UPI0035321681
MPVPPSGGRRSVIQPFHSALPRLSASETMFDTFMRAVAALCAGLGLLYWIRLIGIYDGLTWRFDLMPVHWQVAAVCLAVLYPFAASGLWMLASWGPVIWFVCAASETIMYAGFPELYGRRDLVLVVHALTAVVYAGFRVHRWLKHRREEK